jgi:hypothetical protein
MGELATAGPTASNIQGEDGKRRHDEAFRPYDKQTSRFFGAKTAEKRLFSGVFVGQLVHYDR